MDIGDLLFLIFIALGGLSSVLGGKKKKSQAAQRKTQTTSRPDVPRPPRPPTPARREGVRTSPGREIQEARQKVSAEMDRILHELGLGGQTTAPAPEQAPAPIERTEVSDDVVVVDRTPPARPRTRPVPQRARPRTVSLETYEREAVSSETLERAGGRSHDRFHERYIKPLEDPRTRQGPARARRFVNPKTLRQAMLVREILGPPKALE